MGITGTEGITSFPTITEVEQAIPAGRLPYLQLAEAFEKLQQTHDRGIQHGVIVASLDRFHTAHEADALNPPLTPVLSALLRRAVEAEVVEYRDFDSVKDQLVNGNNRLVVTSDNRNVAKLLMRAMLDHGQQSSLGESQDAQ